MQQYRVNYTLLVTLFIGSFLTSGAVYGLWNYQIGRKSTVLLADAEKSLAAGENRQAVEDLGQYLSIHPDDNATRVKYADVLADVAHQDDRKPEEFITAV